MHSTLYRFGKWGTLFVGSVGVVLAVFWDGLSAPLSAQIIVCVMFVAMMHLLFFCWSLMGRGRVMHDDFVRADGKTIYKQHAVVCMGGYFIFVLSDIASQGTKNLFFVSGFTEQEGDEKAEFVVLRKKKRMGVHVSGISFQTKSVTYPKIAEEAA